MKLYMKYLLSLLCLVSVTGCQPDADQITMEKDGVAHVISEDVQFYYPKGFTLETKVVQDDTQTVRGVRNIVELKKNNETLFYTSLVNDTENTVLDREVLYIGDLESEAGIDVNLENMELNSGTKVSVITGRYRDTGVYFKHIVHFGVENTNIYGYYSDQETYTNNVVNMTKFLESIVISNTLIGY